MPRIRWMGFAGLAVLLLSFNQGSTQQPGSVDVKVVKYDGLAEEVLKHRGKVVLVDFWALWCPPCVKSFPNQVALWQFQKDGLVVISVSLDPLKDGEAEKVKSVRAFLERNGAAFPNLILDEPQDLWKERFGFKSIPTLFVFDKQGRWTRFTGEGLKGDADHRYAAVEALVQQYLKQ